MEYESKSLIYLSKRFKILEEKDIIETEYKDNAKYSANKCNQSNNILERIVF